MKTLVLLIALMALPAAAHAGLDSLQMADIIAADSARVDTAKGLSFAPVPDSDDYDEGDVKWKKPDEWLRAPFGEDLLTDPEVWMSRQAWHFPHTRNSRHKAYFAYNRVDRIRFGLGVEVQDPETMYPRFGGRVQYATDRGRWLYGLQLDQPIAEPGRLTAGVSMVRRTDWHPLHQVPDIENSLALLLARNDYRDYWEREGFGVHLAWRIPDFSTASVHYRTDDYRSVKEISSTVSWFYRDRPLRVNPAIDEGRAQTVVVRLERVAHRTARTRAGVYHWIEVEWAGRGLGGDFDYGRALADVRSVVRLTPVSSLSLRGLGGHTFTGSMPAQKIFPLGGVDGLRAQSFARFKGEQILLGQAEYQIELGSIARKGHRAGLYAIVFLDVGTAWTSPNNEFDLSRQQMQTDAGFGFSFSENRMRVYFAKDLKKRDSDFLVSLRLQRPF